MHTPHTYTQHTLTHTPHTHTTHTYTHGHAHTASWRRQTLDRDLKEEEEVPEEQTTRAKAWRKEGMATGRASSADSLLRSVSEGVRSESRQREHGVIGMHWTTRVSWGGRGGVATSRAVLYKDSPEGTRNT